MKNKLSYVVIAVLAMVLVFGFASAVFAADENAVENSQACFHASFTGITSANENSVLIQVPPCTGEPGG